MLNQLSWTTYTQIVIALVAFYYLFILFRYYPNELRNLLKGKVTTGDQAIPKALQYEFADPAGEIHQLQPADEYIDTLPDSSIADADNLIAGIKTCIQNAAGKPFAPAILIPQIKKIFHANPGMNGSPHRPAINELVVTECERLGTALLTEDEVDQWWDE